MTCKSGSFPHHSQIYKSHRQTNRGACCAVLWFTDRVNAVKWKYKHRCTFTATAVCQRDKFSLSHMKTVFPRSLPHQTAKSSLFAWGKIQSWADLASMAAGFVSIVVSDCDIQGVIYLLLLLVSCRHSWNFVIALRLHTGPVAPIVFPLKHQVRTGCLLYSPAVLNAGDLRHFFPSIFKAATINFHLVLILAAPVDRSGSVPTADLKFV